MMEFDINRIKNNCGIEVEKLKFIKDNVALLVKKSGEKFILKIKRPDSSKSWIDHLRFYNESRVYKYFSTRKFKNLNTPNLIHIDSESFLIEYLERCPDVLLADIEKDQFINAYIELQTLNLKSNRWFDLRYQLYRGLFYQGIAVPLLSLRKKIGLKRSLQSIILFLQLNFTHKKLSQKYWLHGDITSNNVFYNKKDNKLYFIDFENMFYTRKWLLMEVIEQCFYYDNSGFYFDGTHLNSYLSHADLSGEDLKKINIKKQIRFSILLSIISNLSFTKIINKRKLLQEFLPVVLENKKFDLWYSENVVPLFKNEMSPAYINSI